MKLEITEISWGINRMTGKRSEKITAKESVDLSIRDISDFGKGKRHFTIDCIDGSCVTLSVHCADSRYNKTWEIKRGEEICYRPRSFDGGYFYNFRLV